MNAPKDRQPLRPLPPGCVVVDCSDWESDIPEEAWSTGRGVNVSPPAKVIGDPRANESDPTDPPTPS